MTNHAGRRMTRETRIVIVMVVLWSIMTLMFDAVTVQELLEQRSSISYAKTTGVVTHSELVMEAEEDTGPYYIAEIEYGYRVGNTDYEGSRYRYGPDAEGDKSAEALVAQFPVGNKVDVYYDTQEPGDAVLSVGFSRADVYPVMLTIAFNVAMVALWCWAIWRIRHTSTDSNPPSSIANPASFPSPGAAAS